MRYVTSPQPKVHELDADETHRFLHFLAAHGVQTIGMNAVAVHDGAPKRLQVSWTNPPAVPIDVSDFPSWLSAQERMALHPLRLER